MRKVCVVSGGITKFAKANLLTQEAMVKDAVDYALTDLDGRLDYKDIQSTICTYFSDHFNSQLLFDSLTQDYLAMCPRPSMRIEGGGATGGLGIRAGYMDVASGLSDLCLVYGFEKMSEVSTAKGNEFIALASDTDFDYPVGGFYSGYYATMAMRHMHEFGTTAEQFALIAVKNYDNAFHNRWAQKHERWTLEGVLKAPMIATPLTRPMVCVMSDGAACLILCTEEWAKKLRPKGDYAVITGVGCGTDTMRLGDRPHGDVIPLPGEDPAKYSYLKGRWPGLHCFRAAREAARQAYQMAGIRDPLHEIDFAEVHDAYASSELQTYEDLGFCLYGEGGRWVERGGPYLGGELPVNPSGGLIACGHPVGATGIMQGVFTLWQLQEAIARHCSDPAQGIDGSRIQVPGARRGLCHSHAGTGTYITVNIFERPQ
ncbi:MAG: thiolase domain-containing protein [Anaerolineae bacterium]|nr:thiolase domain-containing protein [Anaerolineae bacterium]